MAFDRLRVILQAGRQLLHCQADPDENSLDIASFSKA